MTTTNRVAYIAVSLLFAAQSLAAGNAGLKVGDPAPDFLGRDIDGKEIRLSNYAGNVIVVSFFASWCEPCRQELPMLENLQRTGAGKGLQVIAVNWKEDKQAIPHMFLIGKDGKISFVNLGYGESVIDRLIPEVNRALNIQNAPAAQLSSGAP